MGNKVIIHQKIPTKNGYGILPQKTINDLHQYLRDALPEDYIIISTPTDISVIDGSTKIITIDSKEYSYDELKNIIDSQSKNSVTDKQTKIKEDRTKNGDANDRM